MKYIANLGDHEFEIEINGEDEIIIDGEASEIDFRTVAGQPVYSLLINGRSYEALVRSSNEGLEVLLQGQFFIVSVDDERERRLKQTSGPTVSEGGEFHLKSPMPGLIITDSVREGQQVARGDRLIVLESMKMQNEFKAPRAGQVHAVRIRAGDKVDQGAIMVTIA